MTLPQQQQALQQGPCKQMQEMHSMQWNAFKAA
jgi:hypothetical protein